MTFQKRAARPRRLLFILGGIVLGIALVWLIFHGIHRLEGQPPVFKLTPPVESIGISGTITGLAEDPQSGLKRIWIAVLQEDNEAVLLDKEFDPPGGAGMDGVTTYEPSIPFTVRDHGLKDGEAILRVKVSDHSWRHWGEGNQTYAEFPILIDTKAPSIEVISHRHNLNQGGSGLAVYQLSEPVASSGIWVGDRFFEGFRQGADPSDRYLVFFALPHTMGPETQLYLAATDRAGNLAKRGIPYHINARRFAEDTLHISDRFLQRKMPEFDPFPLSGPPPESLIERFLALNRNLRRINYETIQEVCQESDGKMYWDGAFLRLSGSARKAGFADHRTYVYKGKKVDNQVHLGIDLASTARSPVPASNEGRVHFVGDLGIYGKTVIIDHGFSLFSMYSHLSGISVSVDQMVSRGETIGLTGMTGLAGGDHLHFSILVQGTFVNPVEWWDENWINNNIANKLDDLV